MIRSPIRRPAFAAALLLLAAGLGAPAPARATRYAGEFLRIGVGARALGMGSAFMGLSDDGTAAYWNPAGLATLEHREITAMHAEQFGSIVQYDFLSYVMPIGELAMWGTSGVSKARLSGEQATTAARASNSEKGRNGMRMGSSPARWLFLSYPPAARYSPRLTAR